MHFLNSLEKYSDYIIKLNYQVLWRRGHPEELRQVRLRARRHGGVRPQDGRVQLPGRRGGRPLRRLHARPLGVRLGPSGLHPLRLQRGLGDHAGILNATIWTFTQPIPSAKMILILKEL